ncbi:MAG TPA: TIGR03619 family F420-dependent LLM class oxidoreductase [Streptosporangiaceae bacterium]
MAGPVTLSLYLLNFTAEPVPDLARMIEWTRAADEAGLDRVILSEHVVLGEHLDLYASPELGGIRGGTQPTGPDGSWLDPLATIAYLSAVTSRVRFATGVLLAALRSPVILAKTAATIDVLSGGRLELGVGVGWQREEYDATGRDFARRGRRLDRNLAVCQALWTSQRVDYADEEIRLEGIHQMPKPAQAGGVPVWVSGTVNPGAMNRLARFGMGWIPWGDDAGDIAAGIARMRAAMTQRDRDPESVKVTTSFQPALRADGTVDPDGTRARAAELQAAGVTDLQLHFPRTVDPASLADQLRAIVSAVRAGRP